MFASGRKADFASAYPDVRNCPSVDDRSMSWRVTDSGAARGAGPHAFAWFRVGKSDLIALRYESA